VSTPKPRNAQQGLALLEALVASAVLGIGLAGATRLTLHALQTASDTRQHSLATTLAAQAMDCLQSGRHGCAITHPITVQGTPYTITHQLRERPGLALMDVTVQVQWPLKGRAHVGTSRQANSPAEQGNGLMVLHSSIDQVPAWLSVSSP
jgi:type II secretory pathway pseudopilin PulG